MKKLLILFLIIKFNPMLTQQSTDKNYKVITANEILKYDVVNMKDYNYSAYNGSTALAIDESKILIYPNIPEGSSLVTSKAICDEMFSKNAFPVLPENDTPYFRYQNWMNKEKFNRENMIALLWELDLGYKEDTFYDDAEKLAKKISEDDRKKLFLVMLYFIGEDLHKICPKADWSFSTQYYFQPFDVPILFYEEHFFSFFYLNGLLEQKLFESKNITFKNIYKKVEEYYIKESRFW